MVAVTLRLLLKINAFTIVKQGKQKLTLVKWVCWLRLCQMSICQSKWQLDDKNNYAPQNSSCTYVSSSGNFGFAICNMESEHVTLSIAALLVLIIAIRKVRRSTFIALQMYFLHVFSCHEFDWFSREGDYPCSGQDERHGYIPDHKVGLKLRIRTQSCLPCGKTIFEFQRRHLIISAR